MCCVECERKLDTQMYSERQHRECDSGHDVIREWLSILGSIHVKPSPPEIETAGGDAYR